MFRFILIFGILCSLFFISTSESKAGASGQVDPPSLNGPSPPSVQTVIIPTMGQWGMIAATGLLGFFAIRMLRNRKDSEN